MPTIAEINTLDSADCRLNVCGKRRVSLGKASLSLFARPACWTILRWDWTEEMEKGIIISPHLPLSSLVEAIRRRLNFAKNYN